MAPRMAAAVASSENFAVFRYVLLVFFVVLRVRCC